MAKPRTKAAPKGQKGRVRDLAPRKTAEAKGGRRSLADSKGQVQGELARFR
jgi:hypothetical protein